ncbi:hypothetical protein [Streptomyces sp. NPDC004728]|uniref:hypothetical protein n=1 Tax=Streptomyces sp. NPDC004728 TaxID=3154289 RepID=UPI0033B59687
MSALVTITPSSRPRVSTTTCRAPARRPGRRHPDARARKKRHPHATRILARAWLRVIWACWRDGACYDPGIH